VQGKTTLLDVLAGRKNTGVIQGSIFVNGKVLKPEAFKKVIGYVEQFDTLSPHDTGEHLHALTGHLSHLFP
jgi:ABC-type multidrug transport system ATPase subunit